MPRARGTEETLGVVAEHSLRKTIFKFRDERRREITRNRRHRSDRTKGVGVPVRLPRVLCARIG
jgi:hypothetical protein